jgi:hypothetical protein
MFVNQVFFSTKWNEEKNRRCSRVSLLTKLNPRAFGLVLFRPQQVCSRQGHPRSLRVRHRSNDVIGSVARVPCDVYVQHLLRDFTITGVVYGRSLGRTGFRWLPDWRSYSCSLRQLTQRFGVARDHPHTISVSGRQLTVSSGGRVPASRNSIFLYEQTDEGNRSFVLFFCNYNTISFPSKGKNRKYK